MIKFFATPHGSGFVALRQLAAKRIGMHALETEELRAADARNGRAKRGNARCGARLNRRLNHAAGPGIFSTAVTSAGARLASGA